MIGNYLLARPQGEVISLDEAITLAIYGRRSADAKMYADSSGEFVIVPPQPIVAQLDPRRNAEVSVGIGERLGESLTAGDLRVLVQSSTADFYSVPRLYWLHHSPHAEHAPTLQDADAPAHLQGMPLGIDSAHLDEWRQIAKAALISLVPGVVELQRPSEGGREFTPANDVAEKQGAIVSTLRPTSRRRSKSGPKLVPQAIRKECRRIFKHYSSKLAELDQRTRADVVGEFWVEPEIDGKAIPAPSRNTVEGYWSEWWAETH